MNTYVHIDVHIDAKETLDIRTDSLEGYRTEVFYLYILVYFISWKCICRDSIVWCKVGEEPWQLSSPEESWLKRCHYRQQRQSFISQAFYPRSDKLNTNFQHGFSADETFLCASPGLSGSVVSGRTQGSSPVNHLISDRGLEADGRERGNLALPPLVGNYAAC